MNKKCDQGTVNLVNLSSFRNVVSLDVYKKSKFSSPQSDNEKQMSNEEALKVLIAEAEELLQN